MEETIINNPENAMRKLNLHIQDITAELEEIKMFVNKQFYLTKKSLKEIDN